MKNNLLRTGQKFKVIPPTNDTSFGPGSLGFMSYMEKLDGSFMNLAQMKATIIRRGKTGKARINFTRIYVPIFPLTDAEFKLDQKAFMKAMPDGGVRSPMLFIKKAMPAEFNVMEMSGLDFLGWAHSQVRCYRNMIETCKHSNWPESKSHPFNRMMTLSDRFEEDPEHFLENLASEQPRLDFLEEFRKALAGITRVILQRQVQRAETLALAAEFLDFTNSGAFIPKDAEKKENEYRFTEDDKALKENMKSYKKLLEAAKEMADTKSKKS